MLLANQSGPNHAQQAPSAAETPTATRDRLLAEAMKLMAREGPGAVSLRRIVHAAGANNPSALHYHFGNREGLVKEITAMLQQWLEPRSCAGLEALRTRPYNVRDVMEAAFGPMIEMLEIPGFGRDAVSFIGRLGWDFAEEGQRLSAQLHRKLLNLAVELLQTRLPHADRQTIQFRLILSMNVVYYGISYRNYLRRSPFGVMALSERGNEERERDEFMDYLVDGMTVHPPPARAAPP
jgi:AcrR family transcriptional regulator